MSEAYEGGFGPLVETTMRVMTWNIWWRFGPWEQRQPAIIETLKRIDADVIALQEVWQDEEACEANLLADALGFEAVYSAHRSVDGVDFGNAILSRWPIATTETLAYQTDEPAHDESRLAIRADVDGPNGQVQVYSTHLNWRRDHSGPRKHQVQQLCQFVADSRPRSYPAIVCGDFNADPTSDEIRMMTGRAPVAIDKVVFNDAWEVAGSVGTGMTWDTRNPFVRAEVEPARRIDFIFTGWPREGGAGHVVDCRVDGNQPVDEVWPSDHFAVVADVRY